MLTAFQKGIYWVLNAKSTICCLPDNFASCVGACHVHKLTVKEIVHFKHHLSKKPVFCRVQQRIDKIASCVCFDGERKDIATSRINVEVCGSICHRHFSFWISRLRTVVDVEQRSCCEECVETYPGQILHNLCVDLERKLASLRIQSHDVIWIE